MRGYIALLCASTAAVGFLGWATHEGGPVPRQGSYGTWCARHGVYPVSVEHPNERDPVFTQVNYVDLNGVVHALHLDCRQDPCTLYRPPLP